MNYRHAYHAGNFADVMKHSILALVIEHMKLKDKPFLLLDTHAGTGETDLSGVEAQKTGEWRNGIARVLAAENSHPALAPWIAALGEEPLMQYPGSPLIAARLMRETDRLAFCELHPQDATALKQNFARDVRVKTHAMDGYAALKSMLPPKERRGVVLIDPPFESRDEFTRLFDALMDATARFATGTYIMWYPVKDPSVSGAFLERLAEDGPPKSLCLELHIMAADPARMTGCGLVVVNPPWTLAGTARGMLDWLAETLAQAPGARAREEWLRP